MKTFYAAFAESINEDDRFDPGEEESKYTLIGYFEVREHAERVAKEKSTHNYRPEERVEEIEIYMQEDEDKLCEKKQLAEKVWATLTDEQKQALVFKFGLKAKD